MTRIGLTLICLMSMTLGAKAQVVVGGSPDNTSGAVSDKKQKRAQKTKNNAGPTAVSSIYLVSNWSSNNRQLEMNKAPYGDSLGFRSNETSIGTWSFAIGIRNRINSSFTWDGGVAFNRNGEQYSFEFEDTSYSYTTTYQYIGLPFRLNFNYGKTVEFFAGVGLMPQLFSAYRQDINWRSGNNSGSEELKSKAGYAPNSFVLSGLVNVGLCLHFEKNWSLMVSPELRYQLTSSYNKQDDFVHKNRAYGITFGLIRRL